MILVEAIKSLRPNEPFALIGEDVENIVWDNPSVHRLTRKEVDQEVTRLEKVIADKAAADATARESAIAHAKSLGFTDKMIAVMYPALNTPAV